MVGRFPDHPPYSLPLLLYHTYASIHFSTRKERSTLPPAPDREEEGKDEEHASSPQCLDLTVLEAGSREVGQRLWATFLPLQPAAKQGEGVLVPLREISANVSFPILWVPRFQRKLALAVSTRPTLLPPHITTSRQCPS